MNTGIGSPLENGPGEEEEGHVGPAPGAVDGEEADARHREAELVAVGVGQQLVGALGGGVQADGVVPAAVLGVGDGLVGPIDRAGGGEDQVGHLVVAAGLQQGHEGGHVALQVGAGLPEGVAHPGARGQVHDLLGAELREQPFQLRLVLQGDPDLAEAGEGGEPGQPRLLERHVALAGHAVQPGHLVAPLQQAQGEGVGDEAGAAGDQNAHPFRPRRWRRGNPIAAGGWKPVPGRRPAGKGGKAICLTPRTG